ncbi:MAG: PEP-CTERM sorting domain-containing protein [Pirellulaceae bacterium]|nr:PEP-CTERM sorting domain-containing protein [Pirellulaceae bacterium]
MKYPCLLLVLCVTGTLLSQPPQVSAQVGARVVGLWQFNEAAPGTANDSSGFGNHGVDIGVDTGQTGRVPSMPDFGNALSVRHKPIEKTEGGIPQNAALSYVDVDGSSSLRIGQSADDSWSITLWAHQISNGGEYIDLYGRYIALEEGFPFYFDSGTTGDDQYYFWSQDVPPVRAWMKGVGGELPPSDVFDQWAHYAIVYDGSAAEDNFKLYRDGDQGPNGGLRTWTVDSALEGFDAEDGVPGAVQIGAQTHPTLPPKDMSLPRNFHGNFDDVAIFNGALTKDEIATIMDGDFRAHVPEPSSLSLFAVAVTVTGLLFRRRR